MSELPEVLFVGLLRTEFRVPNFLFSICGNMMEKNMMYHPLQKVCGKKICHIHFFGIFKKNCGNFSLHPQEIAF